MVAIVAGNGLGLFNTSLNTLGGGGVFGQGGLGQAGGQGFVNASNGNLILQFSDEQLSGLGLDLFHLRTYNAQGSVSDGDADGWRWDGERRLVLSGTRNATGSTVTRTTGDGHDTVYAWNGSRYQSGEGDGAHDTLVWDAATSEWVWTDGSRRTVERYDGATGRLKSQAEAGGGTITYTYDANGRLTSVKDSSGQELVLVYNAAGKLERLDTRTTSGGALTRQVYYSYDASGRLSSVSTDLTPADNSIADGKVYTTSYTYDGSSFRIASVTQSDGTSVAYTYELVGSEYRVKTVADASGTTTFTYDTTNRRTDVSNGLGQVWSYHYDTAGQLIQVQTPTTGGVRLSTSYSYDAQGNVTSVTDGAGNTISYSYDANGNRTLERDTLGNTVRYVYDSKNLLQNVIRYTVPATLSGGVWTNPPDSAAQVTRYAYDGNANLRYVVDATGVVTEYRYSSKGLREFEYQYRGSVYDVSGLSPTATLSDGTLGIWSLLREQSTSLVTRYFYDYRGNLSKRIVYEQVASILGSWITDEHTSITEYVYSEHGQLLQTIAVRGTNRDARTTLSSTTYDGLGRVLSQIDASGTRTTVYNGASRQIAVTNSAGLTTTQTYDTRGRLVSISQAGEGGSGSVTRTTQYVYDAAGRLTMAQDPTGVRTYTFYDEAGRVSARVDGTGAVVEYVYNGAGQLTEEKAYANQVTAATLATWYNGTSVTKTLVSQIRPSANTGADRVISHVYDSAGRRSSTTDAIGTVTTYGYDGRGQLVKVQTGDRITRTFYDAAGRQAGQLDGEGYLRENIYNTIGLLVRVVRYAEPTSAALRVSGTLDQLWPASTGALTTWYYYDDARQQIGSVDEQGFVTESKYNEELNTREIIRYATAYTGTLVTGTGFSTIRSAVSGSASQSTLVQYDGFGRVSTQTTQDGTVTRYEYDTAGRLVKETAASGTTEARTLTSRYNAFGEVTGRLLGEASARITAGMTTAQITAIYDQYGLTWSYDAAGRQVSVRDAFGNKTVTYYDEAGRVTHVVNALGEVKESLYNAFGEVKEQTAITRRLSAANTAGLTGGLLTTPVKSLVAAIKDAATDNKTLYIYDKAGLLFSREDALGYTTLHVYNAHGELTRLIRSIYSNYAPATVVGETYEYDRRGRIVRRTEDIEGLSRVTTSSYDAFGRVTSQVDGRGLTTTTIYDLNGRKITVRDPLNNGRSQTFDAWGRVLSETDASGKTTSYAYDDLARTLTVALPEGVTLTTVRNRHGEVVAVQDGEQNTTQQQYNKDGQLQVVINARNQATTTNTYDNAGRLLTVKDARNSVTTYGYDAAGRVVTRTDALGVITRYAFDGQGRQVTVTQAEGRLEQRVTQYGYDRKGQVVTATQDPDGQALRTTYSYDSLGRQVMVAQGTATSPHLRMTVYTFDKLGRRIGEQVAPAGLNLTTQYRYNGNDQVTRKIDALGNSTWYVYDDAGRLTDTIDALGAVTRNVYDANGRITSTTRYATALPAGTLTTLANTDAPASVSPTANAARDQVTIYAYDDLGRLISTTDALGFSESYTYDDAGNRTSLTNKNGDTWHYRYDELNRLTEEITPQVTVSSLNVAGQVSSQGALLVTRIEYDAAGNVTSRSEGRLRASLEAVAANDDLSQARTTSYAYDAVGRQRLITAPGWYNKTTGAFQQTGDGTANTFQVTTEVTYDALGNATRNRVRISNTGTMAEQYVDSYKTYDSAGRVAHEIDALNAVTAYTYDASDNVLTIKRHANALSLAVPGRGYFLSSDITTASLVPDAANDRTLTMTYDALGRKTSVQQSQVNVYTVAGGLVVAAPTTIYSYDALGQVTRETQVIRNVSGSTLATGASIYRYYDKVGNQIGQVDPLGYYTRQEYDALGQLTRTVEYNTALTSWGLSSVPGVPATHAKDRSTVFAYDRMGRLLQVTQENVRYWSQALASGTAYSATATALSATEVLGDLVLSRVEYDRVGNVQTQRDAAGNLTVLTYNKLGQNTGMLEPQRLVALADQLNPFENNTAHAVFAAPLTAYALNAFGQVISETRMSGATNASGLAKTTKTRYDSAGHEIQGIDAAGAVIDYKVDVAGRRIESRQQVSAQFNAWTGNAGYSQTLRQTFEYDRLGQQTMTKTWYVSNGQAAYSGRGATYNRFGEVATEYLLGAIQGSADTVSLQASYGYDRAGRTIQQQSMNGLMYVDYDMAGHATRSTQVGDGTEGNPDRVTRTVYDASGRATLQYLPSFEANSNANTLTSVSTALVAPTLVQAYDRWGNVLSRTDQRGYVTLYTYDHASRVLTETLPQTDILRQNGTSYRASLIHEWRYDALGNLLHEVDWIGPYTGNPDKTLLRTRTHAYNAVGQLIRDIDAIGNSRYYMVDISGNRIATRDGIGRVSLDTYDAMDRQLTHSMMIRNAQNVLEHVVLQTYKYDQAGRRYAEIDGAVEQAEILGAGSINVSLMGSANYSLYDERDNVVLTRNQSGVWRSFAFDVLNRKQSEADALGNGLTWTYDNSSYGRLWKHTDLGGRQYVYFYNAFGQLAKESLNGVPALDKTYEYHGNGLLKVVIEGVQSYNSNGSVRLLEKRASRYVYDLAGNRVREINTTVTSLPTTPLTSRQNSSAEVYYRYDEQGRMAGMYAPAGQTQLVGVANTSQNYTKINAARVDVLRYSFDELGNRRRMELDTTSQAGARVLRDYWYVYDKEGRVLVGEGFHSPQDGALVAGWVNNSQMQGYLNTYDAAGQLISTVTPKGRGEFKYSGVAYTGGRNIYDQQVFRYDGQGRLITITGRYLGQIDNGNSNETLKLVTEVSGSQITGGASWVVNSDQARLVATYDLQGRLLSQLSQTFKGNGLLETSTDTVTNYRGDGQILWQRSTNQVSGTSQLSYYNDAGMVNAQGNQLSYRIEFKKSNGTADYTNTYVNTYALFETYREGSITVTSTKPGYSTSVTTDSYTDRGGLMEVKASGTGGFTRQFAVNGDGLLVARSEADGKIQNYLYHQGGEVATVGSASKADLSNTYTPLTSSYIGKLETSHATGQGETLASIAQLVWGDARMWYLIADANGLSVGANEVLEAGQTLKIPAVAGSPRNEATTFKPYSPMDIIGDTTPNPAPPPPPKPKKKKCGGLLQAVVVVVAVVATVVTAGAAAAALGGAASTFLGGAAVAAAGAAAGSVAGQLAAMATGLQSGFSWSALGKSVLTGAITGGVLNGLGINGSLNEALKSGTSYGQVAAYSIAQNLVGQGIARAVGVQEKFSWASAVASAVGGMYDMKFGGSGSVAEPGKIGNWGSGAARQSFSWSAVGSDTLRSLGRNVVTTTTQIALNGHGRLDLLDVAADAFGNALGNSIAGEIRRGQEQRKLESVFDKAGIAYDRDANGNVIARSGAMQSAASALLANGASQRDMLAILGDAGLQSAFAGLDQANRWSDRGDRIVGDMARDYYTSIGVGENKVGLWDSDSPFYIRGDNQGRPEYFSFDLSDDVLDYMKKNAPLEYIMMRQYEKKFNMKDLSNYSKYDDRIFEMIYKGFDKYLRDESFEVFRVMTGVQQSKNIIGAAFGYTRSDLLRQIYNGLGADGGVAGYVRVAGEVAKIKVNGPAVLNEDFYNDYYGMKYRPEVKDYRGR